MAKYKGSPVRIDFDPRAAMKKIFGKKKEKFFGSKEYAEAVKKRKRELEKASEGT